LRFCGYQVAAAGWGALALGTIFTIASCAASLLIHYWEDIMTPERVDWIKGVMFFVVL
jgi:hypothetical protein